MPPAGGSLYTLHTLALTAEHLKMFYAEVVHMIYFFLANATL